MKYKVGEELVITEGMPYKTGLYGIFEVKKPFDDENQLRVFLEKYPEMVCKPDYSRFVVSLMFAGFISPKAYKALDLGNNDSWWVKPASLCN